MTLNFDLPLSSLNSPSLVERLRADCDLIAAKAVDALLAILNDPNNLNEARWRVVANLGDIGDIRAVEPLIAAVADPSWEVRASAIWALGMLGDQRAFAVLHTIVENPTPDEQNSYVAARALLRIDPQRAKEALRRAAASDNDRVRSWGRSALANLEYEPTLQNR